MAETKAGAVQTAPKGEKARDTKNSPAVSQNEEIMADQVINPVEESGETDLRHVGRNPSYTMGNIRFERGEVKTVPRHYVAAALASGDFERASDEIHE